MPGTVRPIPEGYHTITPYLSVDGAAAAIEFYKNAFGAKELFRMAGEGGRVGHAELQIGDSRLMLADEYPEMGFRGPKFRGGTSVMLHLYVDDVDTWFARAVAAGARVSRPVREEFYGDRTGSLEDPFGHSWSLATHIRDVSEEEMQKHAGASSNP
ncbi:MAG: VOC family protein [Thermoanaerobaculia bacterium]